MATILPDEKEANNRPENFALYYINTGRAENGTLLTFIRRLFCKIVTTQPALAIAVFPLSNIAFLIRALNSFAARLKTTLSERKN